MSKVGQAREKRREEDISYIIRDNASTFLLAKIACTLLFKKNSREVA